MNSLCAPQLWTRLLFAAWIALATACSPKTDSTDSPQQAADIPTKSGDETAAAQAAGERDDSAPNIEGFNGKVELDIRDSEPDWTPFTPKRAKKDAPNILFVLYDDTGLGAWSPYGGRINMPTLDSIAADGLIYTQWHTTALCSPTRSTLLTGRNHHLNGMAAITETASGFPGSSGRIPD